MRLERLFTHRLIRALRIAIPLLVIVLVAIPAWNYLSRRRGQPEPPVESNQLPGDLAVRTEGFTFSRTEGGRTLFTIRANRNLGFKDNRNMLEDVDVTVFGATENEPVRRIRSKQCSYDQETGDIRFEGDVEAQLDERTTARSSELTYNQRERIVASAQKTILEQPGSMTGQANTLEYRIDSGLLKLAGEVQVQTADHTTLQATSALFQQKENWTTMAGGVFVKSATGWILGTNGRADLEPGTYKPKKVTIEGNVRGESHPRGERGGWKFQASRIEAAISKAGVAELVKARGSVEVEELGGDTRKLTGGEIDATFLSTGKVDVLEARQNARMTLGVDRTLSSSQIRSSAAGSVETLESSTLQMSDSVIEGRQFTIHQGDLITFSTPHPASLRSGTRQSWADRTEAQFDSRTNKLVELVQTGNFRFKDAGREGRAQSARFEDDATVVVLDGSPVVTDSEKRLEAAGQIRLRQKDNSFVATKDVKMLMQNGEDPVLVKAARAEGGSESMLYTGNAELWRGNAYIRGQTLRATSEGETTRLHAETRVQSNFNNIRATSDKLDIDEKLGVAHYTGSVRAQKQDMILETPDMTVSFRDNNVAEIVADGGVVVTRAERRGTGEKAVYEARSDSVTLTGNNAQVQDKTRGTVEGARLLMKTTGETLIVEGGNGRRTVTKHPVKR